MSNTKMYIKFMRTNYFLQLKFQERLTTVDIDPTMNSDPDTHTIALYFDAGKLMSLPSSLNPDQLLSFVPHETTHVPAAVCADTLNCTAMQQLRFCS